MGELEVSGGRERRRWGSSGGGWAGGEAGKSRSPGSREVAAAGKLPEGSNARRSLLPLPDAAAAQRRGVGGRDSKRRRRGNGSGSGSGRGGAEGEGNGKFSPRGELRCGREPMLLGTPKNLGEVSKRKFWPPSPRAAAAAWTDR
jgi:hypothetical protein